MFRSLRMKLVVVLVLLVWVLPVFNDVYARLGSSLTGVAGALLTAGNALRSALPWLLCLLALVLLFAAVIALSKRLRKSLRVRDSYCRNIKEWHIVKLCATR